MTTLWCNHCQAEVPWDHVCPDLAASPQPSAPQPLDWNLVTEAVARTMLDSDTFAAPEVIAAEYARLSRLPSEEER